MYTIFAPCKSSQVFESHSCGIYSPPKDNMQNPIPLICLDLAVFKPNRLPNRLPFSTLLIRQEITSPNSFDQTLKMPIQQRWIARRTPCQGHKTHNLTPIESRLDSTQETMKSPLLLLAPLLSMARYVYTIK
jgi:hypothetical protein